MTARSLLWLRLAGREVRNNRRFSALFCLNLVIGLFGFTLVDTLKESFRGSLASRSKMLLGGDLAVTANRPFDAAEVDNIVALLPANAKVGRETSFYSMLRADGASKLVEVRGIGETFPLYGQLQLARRGAIDAAHPPQISGSSHVWIDPILEEQLGIRAGQTVQLGNVTLTVDDIVRDDPSTSAVSFAIAPRIYVALDRLPNTGLLTYGSRLHDTVLVRLEGSKSADAEVTATALKARWSEGTDWRIRTHQSASEEMGRLVTVLNDYLGLIALAALFFANIGAVYLFRTFIHKRTRSVAILISLGATPAQARLVFASQLILLGLAAAFVTSLLTIGTLPVARRILSPFLGTNVVTVRPLDTLPIIVVATLAGVFGSLLFCIPILARLRTLNPAGLFQEGATPVLTWSRYQFLWFLPGVLAYWALAWWQARSLTVSTVFVAGLICTGVVLTTLGLYLLKLVERIGQKSRWTRRLAFQGVSRDKVSALSAFVALALAATLLNLVPQLRNVVEEEVAQPNSSHRPSLFLFDIQDEQMEPLSAFVRHATATELLNPSPMVRARLTKINNHDVTSSRQHPYTNNGNRDQGSRARPYNLSSRATLDESETLVAGRPFDPQAVTQEISLEERFADRMGLKIGDRLEFDVQGVPIAGTVVNLRRVRWASFQPNFFVVFAPGALDEAPKTWVAAVPSYVNHDAARFQNELVEQFPNVSVVNVAQTVTRILETLAQMALATRTMAMLAIVAGLAVLFSIANHQANARRRQVALLKTLGATFHDVARISIWEFGLIGTGASIVGAVAGLGLCATIMKAVFSLAPKFDGGSFFMVLAFLPTVTLLTGWSAVRATLSTPPVDILKSET